MPTLAAFLNLVLGVCLLITATFGLRALWVRAVPPKVLAYLIAPGVAVHELSHALACVLTGAKVHSMVLFRSDGSGTTAVFTDYLSKVSKDFSEKVGSGKSVSWPGGVGAKGNEGVTGQVKTMPGAIGYLELAYATQNNLSVAALKNKAGEFMKPSIEAISAAASGVPLPESLTVSITDSPVPGAYAISAYTYVIVHEDMADAAEGKAVADFLWWAIHAGQQHAAPLHYAPLPATAVELIEKRIKSLNHSRGALSTH